MEQADDDFVRECALTGVEIMTIWAAGEDSTDFLCDHLDSIIRAEGFDGVNRIVMGLINIAGEALVRLSERTCDTESEILRQMAERIVAR